MRQLWEGTKICHKIEEKHLDAVLLQIEKEFGEPKADNSGLENTHVEGKKVKLLLTISCKNLKNMDKNSLSDPIVIVHSNASG